MPVRHRGAPSGEHGMKVTIITGASKGIGAELARQIAQRDGADAALVLAARNADALNALAEELGPTGARIEVIPTDVTDRAACKALIEQTVKRLGRIDVLVNNAGMSAHANFADLEEADLDWYQTLMTLNFWSGVWLTHAALPHLTRSGGLIVAISSVAGLFGVPGRTAYSASKFAIRGFYEALRAELAGQGVSVMLVYPGIVATDIRKRGYALGGGEAGVSMVKEERMMPVDECARRILRGMDRRKRELLMTRQMRLGRWLQLLLPGLTDRKAMKAVKEEFRPTPRG